MSILFKIFDIIVNMINKLRIAILRGGNNIERDISMKSGVVVFENLSKEKYITYDVIVDSDDNWYFDGIIIDPNKLFRKIDIVFSLLLSDNKIKKILDHFNIPYVGADSLASALSMNRFISKQIYQKNGIKTPYHSLLRKDDYNEQIIIDIFKTIPVPCVVKPIERNFSSDLFIANNLDDLIDIVEKLFEFSDAVLIEEFIKGKGVSCGVIDNFRETKIYSLLPMEVNQFDDFQELNLSKISQSEKNEIQRLAKLVHEILGLRHYSNSDFIISPKRGIYILETNPQFYFNEGSSLVKSLEEVGSSLPEFLDHLIKMTKRA